MEKRIYICDKCKKEIEETKELWRKPNEWKQVKIKWGQYDEREYLLCDECCEKLGIPVIKQANSSSVKVQDNQNTAQRLCDIIAEIIEENK